jgi:uncharacterized protein with HEPN domain
VGNVRDRSVLEHILERQKTLQNHLKRLNCITSDDIKKDDMAYDICSFNVMQIGELANTLSQEVKEKIHFLDNNNIKFMRNKVAHDYRKVNKDILIAFALNLCKKENIKITQDVIKEIAVKDNKVNNNPVPAKRGRSR